MTASLAVLRKMVVMSQVAGAASRAEGSDNEAVVRFMTLEGYGTGWSSVIVLAFEVLYIGTAAMLWAGLRWAAGEAGALPFDVIRIPDLAVPHFRPVWEVSYFALALILGASAVLTGRVFARISVSRRVPVLTSPVWQMGIAILAAFVAPAGVLLFGIGVTWLQAVAVPSLSWRARLLHGDVYPVGASSAAAMSTPDIASVEGPSESTLDGGAGASPSGVGPALGAADGRAEGSETMGGGFDDRPVWERDGGDERPIWADADGAAAGAGDDATPTGDAD